MKYRATAGVSGELVDVSPTTPLPIVGAVTATTVESKLDTLTTDVRGIATQLSTLTGLLGGVGCYATASHTPAAAAYLAGDMQDVAKAYTWRYCGTDVLVPATALIRITRAELRIASSAIPSGMTTFTLGMFKAARAVPLADNDADSLTALPVAEAGNFIGGLSLGAPVDVGEFLYVNQDGLSKDVQLVASGMVCELITDGAHTASAVARTPKLFGIVL